MIHQLAQCPIDPIAFTLNQTTTFNDKHNRNPFKAKLNEFDCQYLPKITPKNDEPMSKLTQQTSSPEMQLQDDTSRHSRIEFPWDTIERIANTCTHHAKYCATIIPELSEHNEILIENHQGEPLCLGALSLCLLMAADCFENPDKFNSVDMICGQLQHYVETGKDETKRPFFSDDKLVDDFLKGPCETLMPYCGHQSNNTCPDQPENVTAPEPSSSMRLGVMTPLAVALTTGLLALGLSSR